METSADWEGCGQAQQRTSLKWVILPLGADFGWTIGILCEMNTTPSSRGYIQNFIYD